MVCACGGERGADHRGGRGRNIASEDFAGLTVAKVLLDRFRSRREPGSVDDEMQWGELGCNGDGFSLHSLEPGIRCNRWIDSGWNGWRALRSTDR